MRGAEGTSGEGENEEGECEEETRKLLNFQDVCLFETDTFKTLNNWSNPKLNSRLRWNAGALERWSA